VTTSVSGGYRPDAAHPTQVNAIGRASSRAGAIGSPQVSHVPYRPAASLARASSMSTARVARTA